MEPIEDIKRHAERIMRDLGAGYSETVYQHALYNRLAKQYASVQMEKTIPVIYESEVIGTCRADIVTETHIIEVKAMCKMPPRVCNQIRKYMINMKDEVPRWGVVINFNQDTEQVEFITAEPISTDPVLPIVYKRRKPTPEV